MRFHDLVRPSLTQHPDAGVPTLAAIQFSGQNEPVLQSYAEQAPLLDATNEPQSGKPEEAANLEIERIASAVDLAIALEDN